MPRNDRGQMRNRKEFRFGVVRSSRQAVMAMRSTALPRRCPVASTARASRRVEPVDRYAVRRAERVAVQFRGARAAIGCRALSISRAVCVAHRAARPLTRERACPRSCGSTRRHRSTFQWSLHRGPAGAQPPGRGSGKTRNRRPRKLATSAIADAQSFAAIGPRPDRIRMSVAPQSMPPATATTSR